MIQLSLGKSSVPVRPALELERCEKKNWILGMQYICEYPARLWWIDLNQRMFTGFYKNNFNQFRFASINEHNILSLLCHNAAGTWNLLFVPALCKTCGSFWVPPVPNYRVRIQVPFHCSGANMFTKIESHFFKCALVFFWAWRAIV